MAYYDDGLLDDYDDGTDDNDDFFDDDLDDGGFTTWFIVLIVLPFAGAVCLAAVIVGVLCYCVRMKRDGSANQSSAFATSAAGPRQQDEAMAFAPRSPQQVLSHMPMHMAAGQPPSAPPEQGVELTAPGTMVTSQTMPVTLMAHPGEGLPVAMVNAVATPAQATEMSKTQPPPTFTP